MGQAFNNELIFTGTVRSFYSKAKAEAFADELRQRDFNVALTEEPGQDLRWTVTVLGDRAAVPGADQAAAS